MDWMKKRKDERGNIFNYFPEAKSVISVGLNYYVGKNQNDLYSDYKFSNYAWGDDYHSVLKKKLFELLDWIKRSSNKAKGLVCVDTAPVMEKVWAREAGLEWIGKHTNLITKDYGSWIFLGELITFKVLVALIAIVIGIYFVKKSTSSKKILSQKNI